MQIDISQFSSREKDVVTLLMRGRSNKEIALALSISVRTVEFHLKNIYGKLQVKSRTEAVLQLGESTGTKLANKPAESTVDGTSAGVENDANTIPTRRIPMKHRFYIIGGSLLAVVLVTVFVFARLYSNNPHIPPAETLAVSVTAIPEMSYMGTSFILSPSLGDGTQNEIVPQSNEFATLYPKHIKITLVDYPLAGTTLGPQILVFPAKEFAQMSKDSETTINNLQNILLAQQALPAEQLPFLPAQAAAQLFHAQEKFLSFKNGTGIRYITQYSQAHFPAINNTDVFYTFQGITSDGNYYVSVILPVNLDYLATKDDPEAWKNPADWQTVEKYPNYLNNITIKLNQAENPFNPSLASLDDLAQSLLISGQ